MARSEDRRESSFDHIGVFFHTQMRRNHAKKSMGISLLTCATVSGLMIEQRNDAG